MNKKDFLEQSASNLLKKSPLPEALCLVAVVVSLYGGTLDHSFHFDDKRNIAENHAIQVSGLSLKELYNAGFNNVSQSRPAAFISFALNYYCNGLDVKGYHVVNILIHLFSGFILFLLVKTTMNIPLVKRRYGEPGLVPFATALIWLTHPLHTQSVTYIVQRMNNMAGMFYLLAMLMYAKARMSPRRPQQIGLFLMCIAAGLLAFGSKENTATLPIYILIYDWFFFQDMRLRFSGKKLLVTVTAILGVVVVFYLLQSDLSLTKIIADYDRRPFTPAQRLMTEWRVVVLYASLLFYPAPGRLNLDYDFPLSYSFFSPLTTIFSLAIILGLFAAAICLTKKHRLHSFCILWFLGNLVMESSIIPLEVVYEHRTYLPSMSAILLLVIAVRQIIKNNKAFMVFILSSSMVFSVCTYERNKIWRDKFTLWTDCHKKSPNKARVNQNLGSAYIDMRRPEKAIPYFHKALQLYMQEIKKQPSIDRRLTSFHLRNVANAYKNNGEYAAAIAYYLKAQKEFFRDADLHFQLGYCYLNTRDAQRARDHFLLALDFSTHPHANLRFQTDIGTIKGYLEAAENILELQKQHK